MSGADGVVKAVEFLLSPETPLWVKIAIFVGLAVAIALWWTRPLWHDLQTPNAGEAERKARPPFD